MNVVSCTFTNICVTVHLQVWSLMRLESWEINWNKWKKTWRYVLSTINYTNTMLFGIYPTFLKNSNLCTDSINCLSKCICLLYIFYLFKILVSNFQSNYTWVTVFLIRKKYLCIFIRLHLWYKQMVTASIILNRTWFKKIQSYITLTGVFFNKLINGNNYKIIVNFNFKKKY